jgi:transketolase
MFANTIYEAARKDPRLCMVVADISPAGSMEKFRQEFPERFVNVGVAEQIMIGMCAGMAMRGLRPFAYTIATFTFYRPFEFVRDDLCYQNLPVTIVGIGGGVTYSTLGSTHHAQEDVAVARAVPNFQVLAPCDPAETREAALWTARQENGPVYLRLGKAGEPVLTADAPDPFVFGKVRCIKPGTSTCVLGYGPILKMGVELAARLEAKGESTAVVSLHTVKPLDLEGIARILHEFRRVVVLEEMSPNGSIGKEVKALAYDSGSRAKVHAFSLQDEFIHCYGKYEELLAAHGLSMDAMLERLERD